jgi:uncharacterized protein (DUF2235 family)
MERKPIIYFFICRAFRLLSPYTRFDEPLCQKVEIIFHPLAVLGRTFNTFLSGRRRFPSFHGGSQIDFADRGAISRLYRFLKERFDPANPG